MIAGLGKEQVTLGSAPDNDVVVQGPGVAPHHARIVHQGGQLAFVCMGAAPSSANGAPVPPSQALPFDFRTVFLLGQTPVPLSHSAIVSMVMGRGTLVPPRAHIV